MLRARSAAPALVTSHRIDQPPPAASDAPVWLGVAPGRLGLPRLILRHLVESRYAATEAGGLSWAMRSAGDIYAVAGGGAGIAMIDTQHTLEVLRSHGLVEAITVAPGTTRWMATKAGASAVEHSAR